MSFPEIKSLPVSDWSKDFVEHLRTVHFTVTVLAIALLMIVIISRKESENAKRLAKAQTQATQIAELQEKWTEIQSKAYESAVKSLNLPIQVVLSYEIQHNGYASHVGIGIPAKQLTRYENWKFSSNSMAASPGTLAAFRSWWNELHRAIVVTIPDLTDYRDSAISSCDAKISGGGTEISLETCIPDIIESSQIDTDITVWTAPKTDDENIHATWNIPVELRNKTKAISPSPKGRFTLIITRFFNQKKAKIDESFLKDVYNDWRISKDYKDYDEAFAELAEQAHDLETISLREVPTRLREMQSKAEQGVEWNGIKIPSADAARWGIWLMIAVQLYFWIHLAELSRKIRPEDPGWDVAWIGVYSSRGALVATIISSCALPVVSAFSLSWHLADTASATKPWIYFSIIASAVVVLINAAATSVRLYLLHYNRRKRHDTECKAVSAPGVHAEE